MRKTALAWACAALVVGVITEKLRADSTTFDTVLTFTDSKIASGGAITASVAAPNQVQSFAFNAITNQIGTPSHMYIYVNGQPVMLVSFLTDYLGKPFASGPAATKGMRR
jgi:hypothetical protein